MPRTTISNAGFYSLTAHDTPAAWISFISIGTHNRENAETKEKMSVISNAEDDKLYVCNNNTRTRAPRAGTRPTSSIIYAPYPFLVTLANASADRLQTVELSFDNIDRTLVDVLRRADYPLQIDYGLGMVEIVNYSNGDPLAQVSGMDTAEGFEVYVEGLQLRNVRWDAETITGTLAKDDVMNLAFPSNHCYYDHSNFPGLYGLSFIPSVVQSDRYIKP